MQLLENLNQRKQKKKLLLMTHIVVGYPNLERSLELVDTMEQIDRIQRAVERYDRIACVEPHHQSAVLNDVVDRVVALQRLTTSAVRIDVCLDDRAPRMWLDDELLMPAIENVLRNALDACDDGGDVTLTTRLADRSVQLSVSDTGRGMDARECERAMDDFYTTKAQGSGLGLPLAKRVAEAHGGKLSIQSAPSRGTRVTFHFPLAFRPTALPPPKAWASTSAESARALASAQHEPEPSATPTD